MAGRGTVRQGHGNLILTIQYYGIKTTQFFSKSSVEGALQLKRDLEQLRFPSPKMQNIRFVSHGCMMAIWTDPNDLIRRCLYSAVHKPPFNWYTPKDLQRLSIRSFALQTEPDSTTQAQYYDILRAGNSSNNSTMQSMRSRHGPSANYESRPLPSRPQSRAQTQQQLRTDAQDAPPQHQEGMSSSSNHVRHSIVKRPAEGHLCRIPNKRMKIDPLKLDLTTLSDNGSDTAVTRNSRPATPKNFQVTEINAFNANSASPAGSNSGTHGRLPQADIPKQISSSLASGSLSSNTNVAVSLLQCHTLPSSMSSAESDSLNESRHRPSKQLRIDTANLAQPPGLGVQPGESKQWPEIEIISPVEVIGANARVANTVIAKDDNKPKPSNGLVNQSPQGSSMSYPNPTKEDQIKVLERQLGLVRRELREKMGQELKLYRQIKETSPAYQPDYPKCLITRFKDIQQTLKDKDKDLEDAQKTATAAEKALQKERENQRAVEEKLREERKVRGENEGRFKSERIQLERELYDEKTRRMEFEEELQKEGKLRIKAEDAMMKNDLACQAMTAERDRFLTLIESMRKEVESLKENLEMERQHLVALQAKTTSANELEQRLDSQRTEFEEELERERSRRLSVEIMLKDIERECRAPFVVPALLQAFATISDLTTQVTGADEPLSSSLP